jgi:NADPH-dependent glutamate synthase beta subunit-like oxidoreductase
MLDKVPVDRSGKVSHFATTGWGQPASKHGERPKLQPRYPLMSASALTTQCCVVGGGPAGMMEGFLLARAGVDVVVLEKHADFLRAATQYIPRPSN